MQQASTTFELRRRAPLRELLLLSWFFCIGLASSVFTASSDYLVRNWTTADGVPHNTVRAVVQSRDGYLWLGTANGLARFDGVRFKVFNGVNTPELVSDNIFSLFADSKGTLWIRNRTGLVRFSQGRFEYLSPTNSVQPIPFAGMVEDTAGTVWIQGRTQLGRWNGRLVEPVPLPENGPERIIALQPASGGGLWIAARNGLWRLQNGEVDLHVSSPVAELIAVAPSGQLWGLTRDQQLLQLSNRTWSVMGVLRDDVCHVLHAAANGDVWLGSDTRNAVYRWRDGVMTSVSSKDGLEGVRVLSFLQDQDRNVWVALNAGGLFRLREKRVQLIGREQGLRSPNTTSLVMQPDGTVMLGVMGSTLHRVNRSTAQAVEVQRATEVFEFPTAMALARDGGVWAGRFRGSLPRVLDGRVVEEIGSSNGTRSLFIDPDGVLWRGTREAGVEVFNGTNLIRFTTTNGLSSVDVYCFAQTPDGAVWVGTEKGLNRVHNNRITRYDTESGLGSSYISALFTDSRGTLWVGTLGGGLSGWTGSNFVTLTTKAGLVHDAVEQIIEDDLQHLWLGTRLGLVRVAISQLHDFIEGKLQVITSTLIGQDEGLLRPNFWTEYQPACAKASDGRLWFCTGSGIAIVDPRQFHGDAIAPRLHIEEISIDGRVHPLVSEGNQTMEIPPGSERVEVRYSAISSSEPAQVRFRHQLIGYDRDWREAGRARVASYSYLPPGTYQFQVIGVNNDAVWSKSAATVSLRVIPSFWQTSLFRGAVVLIVTGILFAAYRARIAQIERRRAAQEAFSRQLIESQEQERQRISRELHDSLGQNLLVIKNRAALALKQHNDPAKMSEHVVEVSSMASLAIREVREIAHNLRPLQIDELGLTEAITSMVRKMGDSSSIVFESDLADIDNALSPQDQINFFRIAQECLNNVVKHSNANKSRVSILRELRRLRLIVEDDGRGFPSGNSANLTGGSFGLKNIKERAYTLGGNVLVQSSPGQGTRIEVEIPLS